MAISERSYRNPVGRFWSNVAPVGDCWEWQGTVTRHGYGMVCINYKRQSAHRWAYQHMVGEIPEGLQLDHLCRNRKCVNPYHLDPVTQRVNMARGECVSALNARKTECLNGHAYTPENTTVRRSGERVCKACHRDRMRRRRAAAKAGMTP